MKTNRRLPKKISYPEKIGDFPGRSTRNFFEIPEGGQLSYAKASGGKRKTDDRKRKVYRIIDANLNRSREGLRVCEEVIRFIFNDAPLTKNLRKLRHSITELAKSLPLSAKQLLAARNIRSDVGKDLLRSNKIENCSGVFMANIERAEEALRVLEEFSRILDKRTSENFQKLRFQLYNLEKKIIARFPALSHTG